MDGLLFSDRRDAGRRLADKLAHLAGDPRVIVLALPRGGVPVAHEIATALRVPFDVFVVRKIGVPGQEELAMGAIASGGGLVRNAAVIDALGLTDAEFEAAAREEEREVARRTIAYRGSAAFPDLRGRTVVVVDDGIATGSTMYAAVEAIRALGPDQVIVAAPVASRDAWLSLLPIADRCELVAIPDPFGSVGAHYADFTQTSDAEVRALLANGQRPATMRASPTAAAREVWIPCGVARLAGTLSVPTAARGLIVFAHGSGSSRLSKRNRWVAESLNARGFATLLFDLLSEDEERLDRETMSLRFDIGFLADRLVQVTDWTDTQPTIRELELGYFGASTGAAAALVAASRRPRIVRAVVSRGGRPDLADTALPQVAAATLLIVGGLDLDVLTLNRRAAERMQARRVRLTVVPGASHLFEEPGTLEQVARLAGDWFEASVGTEVAPARQPALA